MIGVLLVLAAAGLDGCHALADEGSAARAESCFIEVADTAENPLDIARAYSNLGNFSAANEWYRRALERSPDSPEVRVAWGRLFFAAHQERDAELLFQEALELDSGYVAARIGLAEIYVGRFENGAREVLHQVLVDEPENAQAQLLLSRLELENGDRAAVQNRLENLLEEESLTLRARLDAYALLAAADHVAGQGESAWTSVALELNPRFGGIYAVPAHFYVMTRRYTEAVALYEKALATQPDLWRTHSELGVNLLRVNRLADARRHLERAYEGDPYNAITVNTLRLLDSLDRFETITADNLVLRVSPVEVGALAPIVQDMVDRAGRVMAPRYDFEFTRPVVIEIFEHHDDFAVRTAGLPGIGILGATFGDVIVMDGPSAKSIREGFDWASALWHEIAHVVTLSATANRVSRWLSEGISVLEEWETGPSARRSVSLTFLNAWKADQLLGVASLDDGFMRPAYEGQVMVSYVQAGLVCQLISKRFPGGLARMLEVYAAGEDTVAAVTTGLGITPAELDVAFAGYLDERFAWVASGLDEFKSLGVQARKAAEARAWPESVQLGLEALALYPDYVEPDSPYTTVVAAAVAGGESQLALETARTYFTSGGRDPEVLSLLVEHSSGEEQLAVSRVYARTLPLQHQVREQFADQLLAEGHFAEAAGEFAALLSLEPHDRAAAHYGLATAFSRMGEKERARRELLLALEIAPRYSQALLLLLELHE